MPLCRRKGPPVNTTIASVGAASFSGKGRLKNQTKPPANDTNTTAPAIANRRRVRHNTLPTGITVYARYGTARCDLPSPTEPNAGSGDGRPCESALANTDADEPERVDGGGDERKAVGSSDWGQSREDGAVDLRYAEEIPGQAGDAGACKFYCDPRKGH